MATADNVHANDVFPVRSRVSWGAIFAGAFVALAVYVLLSVLGVALGLSVMDRAESDNLATGAAIWAVATTLLALFAGGCVTTQCTAGENKTEAAIYGAILWGVMFTLILMITGGALRAGFGTMLGAANVATVTGDRYYGGDFEQAARRAGVTEEQIEQMRASVREHSPEAAWWSFFGVLLSMAASIGGALAGAGPTPMLGGLFVRRTTVHVGGGATAARP